VPKAAAQVELFSVSFGETIHKRSEWFVRLQAFVMRICFVISIIKTKNPYLIFEDNIAFVELHIPYLNFDKPTARAPMLTTICARNRAKPVPRARNADVDTAEYSPDMEPTTIPNATTENAFSTVSAPGNARDNHPPPHKNPIRKYFHLQRSIFALIKVGKTISHPNRIHPRAIVLAVESGPKFGCVHHT
jgi:hypothetical protein